MTTMLTTEPFDFNTTVEETTAPLVTTTVGVDFTTPPVTTTAAGVSRIKKRSTGTVHPDTPPPIVTASTDAPTPNNSTGNWTRGWNATFLTTTPVVLTTEPYVYEPLCETTDGPCDSCYQPIRIKAKHNVSIRGRSIGTVTLVQDDGQLINISGLISLLHRVNIIIITLADNLFVIIILLIILIIGSRYGSKWSYPLLVKMPIPIRIINTVLMQSFTRVYIPVCFRMFWGDFNPMSFWGWVCMRVRIPSV